MSKKRVKNRKRKYTGPKLRHRDFVGFSIEHWKGWGSDGDEGFANLRNAKGHPRGPEYWDAMCKFEFKWQVLAQVKLRIPGEKEDIIKSYEIRTTDPCKLNDLEQVYKEHEADLISKTQERHIIDTGWWACAIG